MGEAGYPTRAPVNYSMKLVLPAEWTELDEFSARIREHLPEDIAIRQRTAPTEPNRMPEWAALGFSRNSGTPEELATVVERAALDARLADRFEPA